MWVHLTMTLCKSLYTQNIISLCYSLLLLLQPVSNILIAVQIGPGSKYQKSKIHWLMRYVKGVLSANFEKFALTDFAQKRPNRFHKKADCSGTANLGGYIFT